MKSPKERTSKKVATRASLLLNSGTIDEIITDLADLKFKISYIQNKLDAFQRNIKSVAGSSLTQREK